MNYEYNEKVNTNMPISIVTEQQIYEAALAKVAVQIYSIVNGGPNWGFTEEEIYGTARDIVEDLCKAMQKPYDTVAVDVKDSIEYLPQHLKDQLELDKRPKRGYDA